MAFRMFRYSRTMACAMAAAGRSLRTSSTPSARQARRVRRLRMTTIGARAAVIAVRGVVAAYWLAMAVAFSPLALLCWLADSE